MGTKPWRLIPTVIIIIIVFMNLKTLENSLRVEFNSSFIILFTIRPYDMLYKNIHKLWTYHIL